MKKKIITILCLFAVILATVWISGFFPVARVNGEFVMHRVYRDRVSALTLFEEQSRQVAGSGALTPDVKDAIRQSVLQNVISEIVFRQHIEGQESLSVLKERADAVVAETLSKANPDVLPRATEQLYNWSVEEFKKNVLYPQALQNELAAEIEKGGISFEEFARTKLMEAKISLYLVPWKWEKGGLVSK